MTLGPTGIRIERFSPGMEDAVASVIAPVQRDEFDIPITYQNQPDLMAIPDFYQTGVGGFWLAMDGAETVGTIGLRDIGGGAAALRKMFVKASHRGPGRRIAHRLLDALLDHAREKSVSEIFLGTTAKFLAAHRFYEKMSFELVDPDDLPESFPRMQVDTRFYRIAL